MALDNIDIFQLEETIWIGARNIGVPAYDFDFRSFFSCRRPWDRSDEVIAVGRLGAFDDYAGMYAELLSKGVRLINSPEEHELASELPEWYPVLKSMTPRSVWWRKAPSPVDILAEFQLPVFIKGSRQTSRHKADLSIVRTQEDLIEVLAAFKKDSVLHWQSLVCREYVELAPIEADTGAKVPASYEFRTFWWKGRLAGAGHYWSEFTEYTWTPAEASIALSLAKEAASLVSAPFLVIDLAMTRTGNWIVIECNDAQESGYAGVSPFGMWQRILDLEKCPI